MCRLEAGSRGLANGLDVEVRKKDLKKKEES